MFRRFLFVSLFLTCGSVQAEDIHFLVMPEEVIGPISPYVYGLNDQDPTGLNVTVRRLGGNRTTGYNWENNASNAGNDWKHSSDGWLCTKHGYIDCDVPGAVVTHFIEENQKVGLDSLVTLPLAGFVAADKDGEVSPEETAPSKRFVKMAFRKKGSFSLVPNLKDGVVYEDEFVNFLAAKFHKSSQGGVKFFALDNEPSLWSETHPRIHPTPTTYGEILERDCQGSDAVQRVDPQALVFGPVLYGWQAYLTLQHAPDAVEKNSRSESFLDYYLTQMKAREKKSGKRMVHVLDLHWYPEARGKDIRITEGDLSPESVEARLQAPRSLWDPGYMEESWIARTWKKSIQLIPWLKEKIDKDYPGTKLAFTEYDYGAGEDVSGGLAQSDVLGIFGREGIFMSNYWGELKTYNKAAFQLYRNYDGKNSAFGGTSVSAATEDVVQTSIYASTDPLKPGWLWMVVLNKNPKDSLHGHFKIQGSKTYHHYLAYGFDGKSPEIRLLGEGDLKDKNEFDLDLPSLSARLFVCQP